MTFTSLHLNDKYHTFHLTTFLSRLLLLITLNFESTSHNNLPSLVVKACVSLTE